MCNWYGLSQNLCSEQNPLVPKKYNFVCCLLLQDCFLIKLLESESKSVNCYIHIIVLMHMELLILGKSCPSPGHIPHGSFSCTTQHLEGHSLFNTPTYKGKCRYYLSAWLSLCKGLSQRVGKGLRCQCLNEKIFIKKMPFSNAMLAWVWEWLCCSRAACCYMCQWGILKMVSLFPWSKNNPFCLCNNFQKGT